MNRPEPGIYLFVGGPIDGERRYISEPIYNLLIQIPDPLGICINDLPIDIAVGFRTVSYRLEQLREGDSTYFVYVGGKPASGLLISALINGYRA